MDLLDNIALDGLFCFDIHSSLLLCILLFTFFFASGLLVISFWAVVVSLVMLNTILCFGDILVYIRICCLILSSRT